MAFISNLQTQCSYMVDMSGVSTCYNIVGSCHHYPEVIKKCAWLHAACSAADRPKLSAANLQFWSPTLALQSGVYGLQLLVLGLTAKIKMHIVHF